MYNWEDATPTADHSEEEAYNKAYSLWVQREANRVKHLEHCIGEIEDILEDSRR